MRKIYLHDLQAFNIDFNYVEKCEILAIQLGGIVCRLLKEEASHFVFIHRQQETRSTHTHTQQH